jgi:hypothetical protein
MTNYSHSIIPIPKRLLSSAVSRAFDRQRTKDLCECADKQGLHFEPDAPLVSRDARSNSPKPEYSKGDVSPRDENGPQTVSGSPAILRDANLPTRSKKAPGSFDIGRRSQPNPRKKTKRRSLTEIEGFVDEIADEVNKRADEIAAVVKSVLLPPASSDIEREKQVDSMRPATRRVKGQRAERRSSLYASVNGANAPANTEAIDNSMKGASKPRLPREDSMTTLVSTLSDHSQTSNSSLTVTRTKQAIPRHKIRMKRIRDSDSEADPLNL